MRDPARPLARDVSAVRLSQIHSQEAAAMHFGPGGDERRDVRYESIAGGMKGSLLNRQALRSALDEALIRSPDTKP